MTDQTSKSDSRLWRVFPKVSFVNYARQGPGAKNAFKQWFYIRRFWGGRIINIGVRHWAIVLDFRRDWVAEMKN